MGEITYIGTDEGWLYLATVVELLNREVVGESMGVAMVMLMLNLFSGL